LVELHSAPALPDMNMRLSDKERGRDEIRREGEVRDKKIAPLNNTMNRPGETKTG
jgi:hypothetical protein